MCLFLRYFGSDESDISLHPRRFHNVEPTFCEQALGELGVEFVDFTALETKPANQDRLRLPRRSRPR
jgi:hypothetical protein